MSGIQPSGGVGPAASQNTIANPSLAAGCANLWYAPRCNPRLDPFAMNAVIAEIINLTNCGGTAYDCNRLDNLCIAVQDLINDKIFGCMERTFPQASAASCTIEQLVLSTDANGCARISRYNAANASLAVTTSCQLFAPGTGGNVPADPTNPATFYNLQNLAADQIANTINEARLAPNRVLSLTFNVPCDGMIIEFVLEHNVIFNPSQNGGNGAAGALVYRLDGTFNVVGGVLVDDIARYSNYETVVNTTLRIQLNAGLHIMDLYAVAQGAGRPPAQVPARCTPEGVLNGRLDAVIPVR